MVVIIIGNAATDRASAQSIQNLTNNIAAIREAMEII